MLTNLFGFPLFKTEINPTSYDKESIISTIERNYAKDSNRSEMWGNVHHMYADEGNSNFEEVDYSSVIPIYDEIIKEFLSSLKARKEFDYNCQLVNYTAMRKSQSIEKHHHLGADFYLIHYAQFKEGHKGTSYVNEQPFAQYSQFLMENLTDILDLNDLSNSWLVSNASPNLKEDDVIIVPSILSHYVEEQVLDETRIAIVININLKGRE